jgi:Tol biopolymer transport system component
MEMRDGIWTEPRPSNHTQNPYDPDLPISPDERTLFFALNRSTDGMGESETGWDMWMTKWTDQGFSHIRRLAEPVSSEKRDAWASLAQNGNLYFMSNRNGSYGRWDIYKALYEDGQYVDVHNIGRPVNSEESEADPAIAPDESYLLFCSSRAGGFGESDLYIAFRKQDGSWTTPQNMGPVINTSADEEKPYVTSDGKYLFFSNDAPGNLEIYWVDARIIKELKAKALMENE